MEQTKIPWWKGLRNFFTGRSSDMNQKGILTNNGGLDLYFAEDGKIVQVNSNVNKNEYLNKGYAGNAVVYSIIKHISDKMAIMPFNLYQVDDKAAFRKYLNIKNNLGHKRLSIDPSSLKEYKEIRKKAISEVEDHPMLQLLDKLGFEGRSQLNGYRDSTGDAYIWKVRGVSGLSEPLAYRVLPSQHMSIVMNENNYYEAVGYVMNIGKSNSFAPEEVAHWYHWNPYFDTAGSHLYGLSPMRAAYYDIMASNEGKKALASEFKNNGIRGAIVRNTDRPWTDKQRDQVQDYVDKHFNGNDKRGKIRAMNIDAKWMQLGLNHAEMELAKSLQLTKEDLCNVWQFPPRLIAAIEGTFNNVEAAERQLITHCIFPRAKSWVDLVNNNLLLDFKSNAKGLYYDVDISALPEMQTDMKNLVETLDKMPISPNEFRRATGYDDDVDPAANKIFMNNTKVPIDQLNQDLGANIQNEINNAGKFNDYQ